MAESDDSDSSRPEHVGDRVTAGAGDDDHPSDRRAHGGSGDGDPSQIDETLVPGGKHLILWDGG